LDPDAIVIHGTELVADHEHPAPVPTLTLLKADADVNDTLVVESTTAQKGAAWVTENTRPPIAIDPVLAELDVFAAIEYWTVPLPEPLPPLVTVSQETALVALQEHAAEVVTVTLPDDGSEPEEMELGEMEMSHVPACSTVSVRPAIVSVPVRGDGDVFAATA
jgi:hypothetical protein